MAVQANDQVGRDLEAKEDTPLWSVFRGVVNALIRTANPNPLEPKEPKGDTPLWALDR